MAKNDLLFIPAHEMRDRISRGDLSSLELTEMVIEQIEKVNSVINAIVTPTFDVARQLASTADKRVKSGVALPILNGIPTSIKDLLNTRGIRTTFGSRIYEHNVPDEDDAAVGRLHDAGMVMLGKTNTPEFGHSGTTDNLVFGRSNNPWDPSKTPGGSSGGAAAACACGASPLALGSDGGGSLRHPAGFCGVFALKPSFGRIPVYPTRGIAGTTITHLGPITRYVKDAALMMDAMKGPLEEDRDTLPREDMKYYDHVDDPPKKLKIGYSMDLKYAKAIDVEVAQAVETSVHKFEKADWIVEPVKIKLRNPENGYYIWYTTMYGYDFRGKVNKWRDQMTPNLVRMIEAGMSSSGTDIFRALDERKKIYAVFNEFFKNYDILVTPTTAVPAFEHGIMYPAKINGKGVSPTGWMPFTFPFNFTGHPAANVPCGFTKNGLPIGMQIVGRRFSDLQVLQVSRVFEELAPWQEKKPDIAI
ncbi:MAG: amidase [Promethearchaeota archaeon]